MSLLQKISFLATCIFMSTNHLTAAELSPIEGTPELKEFPARITEEPSKAQAAGDSVPVVQAKPLTAEEAKALLGRLPPLPATEEAKPFDMRPSSEPPPKAGNTIQEAFPPTATAGAPPTVTDSKVLNITRYAPQGDVKVAQQISISFDHPMVAVSTQNQTVAESVPVSMTPNVEGHWRWVGTQTLVFEAKDGKRLPMATEFKLSVPAATKAADGSTLTKGLDWSFKTPVLKMEQSYPTGDSVPLTPILFLSFNQRIDAQALLPFIQVQAKGQTLKARLAAADEIKAAKEVDYLVQQALPDQYLILKLEQPLPPKTKVDVKLAANAPSAEGSRVAAAQNLYSFSTYAPLAVTEKRCGYEQRCTRSDGVEIGFNNQLAPEQDLTKLIEITPKPATIKSVQMAGSSLWIQSDVKADNTYTITLPAELRDVYGQTLGTKQSYTFKVQKSPASLSLVERPVVTLDPNLAPQLPIYTTNFKTVKLTVQKVAPSDWPAYLTMVQQISSGQVKAPFKLPGQTVNTQQLTIKDETDEFLTTPVDLSPWLKDGKLGHLVVLVEPGAATVKLRPNEAPAMPRLIWVQGTKIGLDAYAYHQQLLAWAGDLSTGKALDKVTLSLHSSVSPDATEQVTDADGLAELKYLSANTVPGVESIMPEQNMPVRWLEARLADDVAFLAETDYIWSNNLWQSIEQNNRWLWYVQDDRHLYRPNEQVHIKGWLREQEATAASALKLPKELSAIKYEVMDSAGNKIAEGETKFTGLGGFNFDFTLPSTPNLGHATVNFTVATSTDPFSYSYNFDIQEFRTPEFEVKTELGNAGPYVGNDPIRVAATASYYAGGGLAAAPVNWSFIARAESYTPPNRDEWAFGIVQPYWLRWWQPNQVTVTSSFQGKTDSDGQQQLVIQPELSKYPLPVAITAEARVSDVNRQEWVSSSNWIIHPAATYVGLKTDSYFVEQNNALTINLVTTDIDGKAVANSSVVVEASLDEATSSDSKAAQEPQRCEVSTDTEGLAKCEFKTEKAGRYTITATTMDSSGRRNMSRINRWVSGDTEIQPVTASTVDEDKLQLISDKESYAPNETAKILVQAPFKDAEGLLLVNHDGLLVKQRFSVAGNSHTLELPLKAEWLPNVQIKVELTGKAARSADKNAQASERPAFAVGDLNLKISKAERTLKVAVAAAKETLAPAEETAINVSIQNEKGEPVANAEVALMVVDEAILTAGGFKLADPLESFYPLAEWLPQLRASRSTVLLANLPPNEEGLQMLQQPRSAPIVVPAVMAAGGARSRAAKEAAKMSMDMAASANYSAAPASSGISLRSNFNPLAAFVPSLVTDASGKATTIIKLPDNLTRYRIMAIAAQDAIYYGKGESHLTARKPLMVRPSAPRFLNYGDSFELPVVLQNQTDQPMAVQVALAASNLALTGAAGFAVDVPANNRVELRFPAKTVSAGQASYQIAAAAGNLSDAAKGSLPVWTPATSEAFATYGVIDQGAISQAIETPKEVIPQFGQLEISTSSTALQSLTDAYIYLQDYPYSCSEQVASRILSTSALKDVLQAFKVKDLPSPEAIEQSMNRDLALLRQRQTSEGGFSLWDNGQTWPYVSVHAVHAMLLAKEKGYRIDQGSLDAGLSYLNNIKQHLSSDYSPELRQYIEAYSLYVRELAGDHDSAAALALIKQAGGVTKLPSEAVGWLLNVLATDATATQQRKALVTQLLNRSSETAAAATIKSDLGVGSYWVMHSSRAASAIAIEALLKDSAKTNDLLEKLVRGLQTRRTNGHWGTTQDNVFVLLALDKYFQQAEGVTPDFVAKAWLGNDFAGEHSFKGRSTDTVETEIPMEWLLKGDARRDLVLDKQGEGRLYYRIGLKYAPQSLDLAAAEHGFTVTRSYRGLDKADDVKQSADGSWQIKAGSRVEVTLTMQANAERYHVALVDPLPAGLEAMNPALAVTSQTMPDGENEESEMSWLGTWYEQQNLRDERVEAFTTVLPEGVYTYRYIAKATTPGNFVVPPAKAEEMYAPETFGRSASAKVVVE